MLLKLRRMKLHIITLRSKAEIEKKGEQKQHIDRNFISECVISVLIVVMWSLASFLLNYIASGMLTEPKILRTNQKSTKIPKTHCYVNFKKKLKGATGDFLCFY